MKNTCVFTIVSKNYLAYARTLLKSVEKIHPEYKLYLCLADKPDGYFDIDSEPYNVVLADEIGITNFQDLSLRYDIMEFNTAVKPFMFRWLFDHTEMDTAIYLDPDIRVYSRLEELEKVLEAGASVVLTPHITSPLEDGKLPNDSHMLQSGVFNLGFLAANRCEETLAYMDWWARRLTTQCLSDVSNGLFTDQKWCDLAPCFLDHLKVFKDPGYNVAYWNLAQREVVNTPHNGWQVNDRPLAFFHFSGVDADKKNLVSKHQNRFQWKDIESCQPLFEDYLDSLIANGWSEAKKWPYAYSTTMNGMPISGAIRALYRKNNSEPLSIATDDIDSYLIDLCNSPATDDHGFSYTQVSSLMLEIYRSRADLQVAFNLGTDEGIRDFCNWFETAGEKEYGLPKIVSTTNQALGTNHRRAGLKNRLAKSAYRFIELLDPAARKLARVLPPGARNVGKRAWLRIKSKAMRAF